jgi:thiol-disulfide isomerase/thioredoxin
VVKILKQFILFLVLFTNSSYLDAAPRKVICENFTATWCTYCPDVANGLIMLMDEFPDTCFAMQIHGSDSYSTTWGNLRLAFYNVPGFPTVWMDGVLKQEGSYGSPTANYNQLRSKYLSRIAVPTDVTMDICGTIVDSDTYSVTLNVGIESGGSGKTMRLHCSHILHHYPSPSFNYGCFMQASSQDITLAPGESTSISFTMDLDSVSLANLEDVSFIGWAQTPNSTGPAEVYQSEKHVYNSGDCQEDIFIVGPKGDFSTISDAIAASGTGDTVRVMSGTYFENIDFGGRGITIESISGADVTTIDGGGNASVVRLYNNASSNAVLNGFTIQNGNSPLGGGILTDGSPIISNCIIKNNSAQMGGGLYHLQNGTTGPSISNSFFCNNTPSDIYGDWVDSGGNVFDESCGDDNCPADVNGDGNVNVSDLLAIIDAWGGSDPSADINDDGTVNVVDLLEVVGSWGSCT